MFFMADLWHVKNNKVDTDVRRVVWWQDMEPNFPPTAHHSASFY